jgi:hypothetical protein
MKTSAMLVIEWGPPFHWLPGVYRSEFCTRVWWFWWAIAHVRSSLKDYSLNAKAWTR